MNHIEIVEGDITRAEVDAIVNAANPKMLGGGGVDGAIHKAAGHRLLEECRKIKPVNGIRCPFGSARITPPGNLRAKYVIHAVGPIYRKDSDSEAVLKNTYQSIFTLASEHGCRSIAIPAISCGAYGFPVEQAAKIAISECSKPKFKEMKIEFCLFSTELYELWVKQLSAA